MTDLVFALTFAAALGCGLGSGALFAFSSFVMKALADLPAADGIRAMQSINVAAVTPAFMTALFGPGVLALVLSVWGILNLGDDYGIYLLLGGMLYLAGPVGVTIAFNVPRNDALAASDAESADGKRLWLRYLSEWTRWNHVRVVLGLAAAAMFTVGLVSG